MSKNINVKYESKFVLKNTNKYFNDFKELFSFKETGQFFDNIDFELKDNKKLEILSFFSFVLKPRISPNLYF